MKLPQPRNVIWIIIFLVSFFTRLYQLETLSPVISHDEIYYVAEAKSLSISGKDPTGLTSPTQLKAANPLYAELPGTLMTPAALLFANSPVLAARFTHALLGSLFPLVLGALAFVLFKNKSIAIITACVASVNPWLFQNSRMGFDALFSLFFYFAGMTVLLRAKKYSLPLSFLLFVIGFYQYQGLKLLFIPLIFICIFFLVVRKTPTPIHVKKLLSLHWKILLFFVVALLFFSIHIVRLKNSQAGGRVQDLIFFDQTTLTTIVDTQRRQSVASPIQSLYSNKATALISIFTEKYIDTFNLQQLFVHVDARRNPFAVTTKGIFYLIDLPLIFLGLYYLISQKKNRAVMVFMIGMILISPLPSAINSKDTWMFFRSSFLFPWLMILTALGIYFIWQRKSLVLKLTLTSIYTLFICSFAYDYFFKYPVLGTNGIYFSERIIASYLQRLPEEKGVTVITEEPRFTYESILSFNNNLSKDNITQINSSFKSSLFSIKNVTVTSQCFSPELATDQRIYIVDARTPPCDTPQTQENVTRLIIPSLLDSGALFYVYNDQLCSTYQLQGYSKVTQRVMNVEELENKMFCEHFLTR